MNHLYENIAYLRGLAEGMEIEDSKNGKMVLAIIDVLDEMATAINSLNDDIDELDESVDEIDKDLAELEEDFYEIDDYEGFYDLECPECGELIYIDDPTLFDPAFGENEVICPVCEASIDLTEYGYYDDEDYCECECDCADDAEVATEQTD